VGWLRSAHPALSFLRQLLRAGRVEQTPAKHRVAAVRAISIAQLVHSYPVLLRTFQAPATSSRTSDRSGTGAPATQPGSQVAFRRVERDEDARPQRRFNPFTIMGKCDADPLIGLPESAGIFTVPPSSTASRQLTPISSH
jgi:hypothetical protein